MNELLESLGAPLEIVEGFVQSISVTIPWAALVTDHCTLEVTGLQITCRPKYRTSELIACNLPGDKFSICIVKIVLTISHMICYYRWELGLPRLVLVYDLQHAAGPGVSEGPTRGI